MAAKWIESRDVKSANDNYHEEDKRVRRPSLREAYCGGLTREGER